MNCSRFETLLTDYLDNVLEGPVRLAVEQHLDGCPGCSTLVREVSELREDLSHFPEVAVPEYLVDQILQRTSGKPRQYSIWHDFVLPSLRPFLSQRYAFATVMMFVFISFAVNVMGPGFSASSYSRLSPAALVAKADQVSSQVYAKWREFNDLKARVAEEIAFFKEDLLGRLDYHLVALLFQSYEESLEEETEEENSVPVLGSEEDQGSEENQINE